MSFEGEVYATEKDEFDEIWVLKDGNGDLVFNDGIEEKVDNIAKFLHDVGLILGNTHYHSVETSGVGVYVWILPGRERRIFRRA